ncbi:30S ribosomal protein S13 [Patescibacteria group bacterium]
MARIAGTQIPDNKRLEVALTYIFGIGKYTAKKIITQLKIDPNIRAKDLNNTDIDKIRNVIEKDYKIEGDLRVLISQNVRRLKDVGSWRGMRHSRNLPVRGQRTKTNARTKRGKRVTVGSGRKKAAEKT